MESVFKKAQWACFMQQAFEAKQLDNVYNSAAILAMIEIREAIEEQTANKVDGELGEWDREAIAKLASEQNVFLTTVRDLSDQLKGLATVSSRELRTLTQRAEALEAKVADVDPARLAVLESAVQSIIQHQSETAHLLQELAAKIDK